MTSGMIRAVLFDPDKGEMEWREVEDSWQSFKEYIGDWMEGHMAVFGGRPTVLYCDETGLIKGLTPSVVSRSGRILVRGRIVLTMPDGHGNDLGITPGHYGRLNMCRRSARHDGRDVAVLVCDSEPAVDTGAEGIERAAKEVDG